MDATIKCYVFTAELARALRISTILRCWPDFSAACAAISSKAPQGGMQAQAVKSCLNNNELIRNIVAQESRRIKLK